jgi:clan AA aspartic protease
MVTQMGITYAEIELVRTADQILVQEGYLTADQVRRLKVMALVDSGASLLTITPALRDVLSLRTVDYMEAELADGSIIQADVVGPVEVRFANRQAIVSALVLPGAADVLLGAIPMQILDVLVDPKRERLIVNPDSPEMARMLLK